MRAAASPGVAAQVLVMARTAPARANDEALPYARERGHAALHDRLELPPQRIDAMLADLRRLSALPDSVGATCDFSARPSGIGMDRMRALLDNGQICR